MSGCNSPIWEVRLGIGSAGNARGAPSTLRQSQALLAAVQVAHDCLSSTARLRKGATSYSRAQTQKKQVPVLWARTVGGAPTVDDALKRGSTLARRPDVSPLFAVPHASPRAITEKGTGRCVQGSTATSRVRHTRDIVQIADAPPAGFRDAHGLPPVYVGIAASDPHVPRIDLLGASSVRRQVRSKKRRRLAASTVVLPRSRPENAGPRGQARAQHLSRPARRPRRTNLATRAIRHRVHRGSAPESLKDRTPTSTTIPWAINAPAPTLPNECLARTLPLAGECLAPILHSAPVPLHTAVRTVPSTVTIRAKQPKQASRLRESAGAGAVVAAAAEPGSREQEKMASELQWRPSGRNNVHAIGVSKKRFPCTNQLPGRAVATLDFPVIAEELLLSTEHVRTRGAASTGWSSAQTLGSKVWLGSTIAVVGGRETRRPQSAFWPCLDTVWRPRLKTCWSKDSHGSPEGSATDPSQRGPRLANSFGARKHIRPRSGIIYAGPEASIR
ncbi:hypothetical protein C2E23DRAFT_932883 [Lenzites betulinus]|nr:hypothetical protein C2E23DRAFT_932883 [Lenzites betulinus]